MLHLAKEVLCTCFLFQGSRDSIKEEPETNVYACFYHIRGDFKAV